MRDYSPNLFSDQNFFNLINELKKFNVELEKATNKMFDPTNGGGTNRERYPQIFRLYERHQGLCDIVCNYFTLVKPTNLGDLAAVKNLIGNFVTPDGQFNMDKIEGLSKTHILSIVGFIELLSFVLFKIIPNNILSYSEQKNLRTDDKGINQQILKSTLDRLPIGICVKFSGYQTNFIGIPDTGHSMLISKIDENNYLFFNPAPNEPQCDVYNANSLLNHLNSIAKDYDRIAFIDNDAFMQRVNQNVFSSENELLNPAPRMAPIIDI